MKPYIEFIRNLQNGGFGLVQILGGVMNERIHFGAFQQESLQEVCMNGP